MRFNMTDRKITMEKVNYLEKAMAEFKEENNQQHTEIKTSVENYHKDTSIRLDTLNTVITESWRDMGCKIDKFKDEVMADRAHVASQLARTARIEDLEKKADKKDLDSLVKEMKGYTKAVIIILVGFIIFIIEELVRRNLK
jgi:hypothetical protein